MTSLQTEHCDTIAGGLATAMPIAMPTPTPTDRLPMPTCPVAEPPPAY
jgi:hypothetical protein